MHRDLRGGALDLAEVVGRQFDGSRPDVLLQAMQLRGARDRNDPRLLGEQPGERDLGRRRLLPLRDLAEQIDQGLVRLPGLRREARDDVAEVGAVERRVLVDLAREEALAQRAERNEADAEFLERRQHLLLGLPPPQRVFALECRDRLDGVGATDRLHACFGEAEVLDLAFLNQVLHRSRHVLDRHVRVDAVLIEQVDGIDLEPLERGLGDLLDVLRPAVQADPARPAVGIELEPELGGDHHLLAERGEGFAHELLVRERAVDLGGVEERDAAFDGRPNQRDHLLLVRGRAVAEAHAHAAEPEGRDFQVALSKFALLHCFLLRLSRELFRFERSHVDGEAVLHIRLEQSARRLR